MPLCLCGTPLGPALPSAQGFARRAEHVKQGSVTLAPSLCALGGPAAFSEDSLRALRTPVLAKPQAGMHGGLRPRAGAAGLFNGDVEVPL